MLKLSDEISAFIERKIPLLRIHRYDGIKCTCGKPECRWDAKKGGNAGKHPAEPKGVHSARVVQNASLFEGLNVGVACGRGFVVLDIDPRNGGDKALAELIDANGPLPRTWKVATGGGGTHYYFSVEGEQRSGKRVGGIDLVGLGGYVLAAGSLHPNGRCYEWLVHPDECEMAPLPEWVRDACVSVGISNEVGEIEEPELYSKEEVLSMLKAIDPSCPRETWWRVGAGLKSAGFPMEMWDEWSKGSDKYHAEEIKTEWDSYKIGMIKFGTVKHFAEQYGWTPEPVEKWDFTTPEPEPEPESIQSSFEIQLEDGLLKEIADNIFDSAMFKHRDFAIASAFSIGSTFAQGRFVTPNGDGCLSLYTFLATDSGGGKADYTNACNTCVQSVEPLLIIGELASGQALRKSLELCPSRCLILDEGIKWLTSLIDGKNENAQRLHGDFLSIWSGSTLNQIVTKDSSASSPAVHNPRVTLLGGGPKKSLVKLLQNGETLADEGLLSRIDFIVGEPDEPKTFIKGKKWKPSDSLVRDLQKLVSGSASTCMSIKDQEVNEKLSFDEITQVAWTSEASQAYNDFAFFCYKKRKESGYPSVWSRAAEKALKIATVMAIFKNPEKPCVTLRQMEIAKTWILKHAYPLQKLCEEFLGKSDETKARDKIVLALKKEGGRCSRKKVAKWWRQWSSLDERIRQAAVDGLERDGIIAVKVSGASRNKGEQMLILLSS